MPSNFLSITGQPLELGPESEYRGQCQSIHDFETLNQLGEGSKYSAQSRPRRLDLMLNSQAYGVVYRARDKATSQVVALKKVRVTSEERQNGIPITALREISILRSLNHKNIVNVFDVAVGEKVMDEIYMVMEYAEQVGDPVPMVFISDNP
ncbi:Cdc2- kinase [Pseudocyphellaria aurata]|nr:Cdc2- kinase [Pseudocyphellaria aurata]